MRVLVFAFGRKAQFMRCNIQVIQVIQPYAVFRGSVGDHAEAAACQSVSGLYHTLRYWVLVLSEGTTKVAGFHVTSAEIGELDKERLVSGTWCRQYSCMFENATPAHHGPCDFLMLG